VDRLVVGLLVLLTELAAEVLLADLQQLLRRHVAGLLQALSDDGVDSPRDLEDAVLDQLEGDGLDPGVPAPPGDRVAVLDVEQVAHLLAGESCDERLGYITGELGSCERIGASHDYDSRPSFGRTRR
jgi:hypothetical protein